MTVLLTKLPKQCRIERRTKRDANISLFGRVCETVLHTSHFSSRKDFHEEFDSSAPDHGHDHLRFGDYRGKRRATGFRSGCNHCDPGRRGHRHQLYRDNDS